MKQNRWSYKKQNETVVFNGPEYYTYELDLERLTVEEWVSHLRGKRDSHDLSDLYLLLDRIQKINPKLPIFTNKPEKWFAERMIKSDEK